MRFLCLMAGEVSARLFRTFFPHRQSSAEDCCGTEVRNTTLSNKVGPLPWSQGDAVHCHIDLTLLEL